MTVQNTNRKDVYLTNGTTIYWPYTFEIFTTDGSDLALYETNLTTGETILIDTNLTRDIINSRIKYPRTGSPRPAGYKITVARVTERTQGADLQTQTFDPKNMERGLDKLTAMVQEIDETVSRAAVADISQQGVNFTFPSPVGGKVVGWNAEGTGLINLDNTTLGIEAQMLEATEAAQDAADAANNLVGAFEEDGTTVKEATHAGSADSAIIAEAAKGTLRFWIEGHIGGNSDIVYNEGGSHICKKIKRVTPSGKILKLKRASFFLEDINLKLGVTTQIGALAGSSWTSTSYVGDNELDITLTSTGYITIAIILFAGGFGGEGAGGTLKPYDSWWLEFAFEDA